jgi:TatD DNase family protein
MEAFRSQLAVARSARLPVIIHSRLAIKQVLEALSAESFDRGGILHCYTEDAASALRAIERGFYVSFSGILTYPRANNVREAARAVPADRLLVETDAPYLVPQALKAGRKRNEPAFVVETLRALAAVRGIPYEEAGRLVTENFETLFPQLP